MIVSDLDGTLLGPYNYIPPENTAALRRAADHGIEVAIASGRLAAVCSRLALDMGLSTCRIIGMNGAQIWDKPYGSPIFEKTFDAGLAERVVDILEQSGCIYNAYNPDAVFVNRNASKEEAEEYISRFAGSGVHVEVGADAGRKALAGPVIKFLFKRSNCDEGFLWAEEQIRAIPQLYLTSSAKDNDEVMLTGVGKAEGIQRLCEHTGLSAAAVMAFGDFDNDIRMLQTCGYPVAMGNATAEVMAVAKYITADHMSAGVGKAVNALLEGRLSELQRR